MENAQLYSSANGMQRRDAEEVIMEFCGNLTWKDGARVLDIGCGTGEVTSAILLPQIPKGFAQLVGLDVSPEMVQHARRVHNHPRVAFVQFDIATETEDILEDLNEKLRALENNNVDVDSKTLSECENGRIKVPADAGERLRDTRNGENTVRADRGYDVISSFYCLHWIHNQRLALANIHTLLKPGGDALLVLLAKSPVFSLYDRLSKFSMWKEYMQDVENFISPYHRSDNPLDDFVDVVNDVGFIIIKSECRERSYIFKSTTSLRNAIIAVNPFISRIPGHLQGRYISDCLREVEELKLTELSNNSHKVTYNLLVAHVCKSKKNI